MNQYILLSVLFLFFVYYGGKYVPTVLKQNKEILVGVVGGLVLCSFISLRMEGFCMYINASTPAIEEKMNSSGTRRLYKPAEAACGDAWINLFNNRGSTPTSCSPDCAQSFTDWFQGDPPLVQGCNSNTEIFRQTPSLYTRLSEFNTICQNTLNEPPTPPTPTPPTPTPPTPPDPPDIQWSQCTQDLSVHPVYGDRLMNSAPESINNLNTTCSPSASGFLVQAPIFDFRSTPIARNPDQASMTAEERIAAAESIYNTYPSWRNGPAFLPAAPYEMWECTGWGAGGRVTPGDPESCANKLTEWWGGCIRDHNDNPEAWGIRTNIMGSEGRKLQDAAGYSGGELGYEFFDQISNFQVNYEECGGTERLNSDGPNCSDGCVA